jgi:hypothetical protein
VAGIDDRALPVDLARRTRRDRGGGAATIQRTTCIGLRRGACASSGAPNQSVMSAMTELGYVDEVMPDAAACATIDKPTLLVAASESPPEQREMTEAMADALPDARTALVAGGHLIDPAAPEGGRLHRGSARAPVATSGVSVRLPETPPAEPGQAGRAWLSQSPVAMGRIHGVRIPWRYLGIPLPAGVVALWAAPVRAATPESAAGAVLNALWE